MKVIKKLVLVLIATATLFACQKEQIIEKEIENQSVLISETSESSDVSYKKGNGNNMDTTIQKALCTCTGFTLKNKDGEFSCPSGGSGCSKVQKCPCSEATIAHNPNVGIKEIVQKSVRNFEEARLTGILLQEYFSGNEWRRLFPEISAKPELRNNLKNGQVKVVKKEHINNNVMYLFVESSVNENNIEISDVKHVMEIPFEVLQ